MKRSLKGFVRRKGLCTCLRAALLSFSILQFFYFTAPAAAQGLPLIRNFTVAEYGGHNRCYDIETDEDGTVYVANFEGLTSVVLLSYIVTVRTRCGSVASISLPVYSGAAMVNS